MPFTPGETFGRFRLLSPLGKSDVDRIFRAIDTASNQEVVLRIVDSISRQMRRQLSLWKKASEGERYGAVRKVLEVIDEPDRHGIVLEDVHGTTLETMSPLPAELVVDYGRQIAKALDYLHGAGVVHRDLRPSNIVVSGDFIKVMDFDLASVDDTSDTDPPVDRLPYIAPEVRKGKTAKPAADIFAFGSVLYEMATGQTPDIEAHRISITDINPDMPEELNQIVERCLMARPRDRYSAADLLSALEHLPSPVRIQANAAFGEAGAAPAETTAAESPRWINAWVERGGPQYHVHDRLKIGVNIGERRGGLGSKTLQPLDWGHHDALELLVRLSGEHVRVVPGTHTIVLYRDRSNSESVFFDVEPLRHGEIRLFLSIFLAKELTLLEEFSVTLTILHAPAAVGA